MKRLPVKLILSWLVAVSGLLTGFCGLVISGQTWVGDYDTAKTLQAVGWMLLGLVFLAASFFALYNRRRAACLFLVCVPVAAFCLGYPDAVSVVTHEDGSIQGHQPDLPTALTLEALFYIAIFVPLFAVRSRKRAVCLFLILASFVVLVFAASPWIVLLSQLAGWSAAMVAFGTFWLATHRLGWPPLLATQPLGKRLAIAALGCALVVILDLTATFVVSAARSSLWHPGGSGGGLSLRPWRRGHVAFTARVIRVHHGTRISGKWEGKWAVVRVKEHFWGLSPWASPVALLTGSIFGEGESYFIDAIHTDEFLTRFLPIVDVRRGNSQRLADAALELRLLREAPPEGEPRIVGKVRRPRRSTGALAELNAYTTTYSEDQYERVLTGTQFMPFAGARIRVTGSSGTTIVTADQGGAYEVTGITPDNYTLELLDLPDTQYHWLRNVKKEDLIRRGLVRGDIHAYWNGSLEGTTRDVTGRPVSVEFQLRKLGQIKIGSLSPEQVWRDNKSGSFRISQLEAGRYILQVNPDGPRNSSPYAPLYYPSATRPEDARILEIATDGQHLKGVDFVLKRLRSRNLQVRVVWPTGQPVVGADVFLVYEHTISYKSPYGWSQKWTTDRDGVAEVHVFGDLRIRLWGEAHLPGENADRYSAAVELEGAKLPRRLEMVTSFTEAERPRWP